MVTNIVRPYEVSIWTLQDEFITTLKPFGVESYEQIQNSKMNLKDDGENTFSFEVPMYLFKNGKYVENPAWYNIQNGNLLINMRKIKVIFNKFEKEEKVFEFIILRVTETHEGYERNCEVECEGLAFHELGRQGYKVVLSADEFDNDWLEWEENGREGPEPISNIDYWVKKVLDGSIWHYEIQMDWSAYPGITLLSSKIYNEAYVSAWTEKTTGSSTLIPSTIQPMTERVEIVEASESNRYNLIQSIAEQFQVFTKFVYEYDDNYHITDRKIIFYNSFISEKNGFLDLTYAYGIKNLSRDMDGTDLVTKMYVKPLEDSGLLTGEISITDSPANKSLEDYIFNFDYLHGIGTLSDEQYEEVKKYEEQMHNFNKKIMEAQEEIFPLNVELPIQKAKQKTAEDAIPLDIEGQDNAKQLYNSLTNEKGVISITSANPKSYVLLNTKDNPNSYYINIEVEGIKPKTLKLYYEFDQTTRELSNVVKHWKRVEDEFGNLIKVEGIVKKSGDRIYAIFDYCPSLQYENIIKVFAKREASDRLKEQTAKIRVAAIEARLETLNSTIKNYQEEKRKLQKHLETLLGPALREGNWQPEDQYTCFKKSYIYDATLTASSTFNDNLYSLGWDEVLFADEDDNTFFNGAEENQVYYPCIDLSTSIQKFQNEDFFKNGIFCYNEIDYGEIDDPRAFQFFPFQSRCKFCFLKTGNETIPALMITDVETIDDFHSLRTNAWLGTVDIDTNSGYQYIPNKKISNVRWINNIEDYKVVYPRFKINSIKMLNNIQDLKVYQGNKSLKCYEDYYVNFRDGQYYITIKPERLIETGGGVFGNFKINFHLSNAAEAIYLDAINVLRENAFPKVSYNITPALIDRNFIKTSYNSIGQLIHINDPELKFENVMGYISEAELDLDHPWEDGVVIKNYRTKFEDLFSTIVAQTETIKSNTQLLVKTATLFTDDGDLNKPFLQQELFDETFQKMVGLNPIFEDLRTTFYATEKKSTLAASNAQKIIDGNIGLAFPPSEAITNIELNRNVGLLIEGFLDNEKTIEGFFRVTNGAMGFFKKKANGEEEAMLYFDAQTGDLAIAGTVYARNGWFGDQTDGWIIGRGNTFYDHTYSGGLLYSVNKKAIFSAGTDEIGPEIVLMNADNEPCLHFQDGSLAISGQLHASTGSTFGPWTIGNNAFYRNTEEFGNPLGMYLGKEGISLGSLFKVHFNEDDHTFDYFKISNGRALTDEDLDTVVYDEDGNIISDLYDDDDDYLFKIEKDPNVTNLEEEEPAYLFSIKDIKLSQDFIDSIISNVPEGVYKTTDMINGKPDLPDDAPNGSLGVVYSDTIDSSSASKKFQFASELQSSSSLGYLNPGFARLKAGTAEYNKRYNKKYFGIKADAWNATSTKNQSTANQNNPWVIVGMNKPNDAFHAMLVKVKPNKNLAAHKSFTLNFKYRTQQSYNAFGHLSVSQKRSRGIVVNVYKAGSNGKPTKNGVAVASGTFKVPFSSGNISSDPREGRLSLTASKKLVSSSYYYIVFYSKTPYSTIFINYSSVQTNTTNQVTPWSSVFVKSNDEWRSLYGSNSDFSAPIASDSSLGVVSIGTGLKVTSAGLLSLRIASSSVLGGIKVGSGLSIDSSSILSVPIATSSNPGIVKPGNGLSVNSAGALNATIATSSTAGRVKPGTNLTVDSSGSLSLKSEINVSKITVGNLVITNNRIATNGELRIVAGAHILLVRGNTVLVRSTSDENGANIQSW